MTTPTALMYPSVRKTLFKQAHMEKGRRCGFCFVLLLSIPGLRGPREGSARRPHAPAPAEVVADGGVAAPQPQAAPALKRLKAGC